MFNQNELLYLISVLENFPGKTVEHSEIKHSVMGKLLEELQKEPDKKQKKT